jgi:uncharacterized membrane protein
MFVCFFSAVLAEVMLGDIGIVIPLTAMAVFYFSVSFGWQPGLIVAVMAGSTVDLLYARSIILSPLLFGVISLMSIFWLLREESKSPLMNTIPGLFIGLLAVLPPAGAGLWNTGISYSSLSQTVSNSFLGIFSAVLGLPVMIVLLDELSSRTGLPGFRGARDRILRKTGKGP